MTRYARHLQDHSIPNPFPGIVRLETAIGRPLAARIGSNESIPLAGSPLDTLFGPSFAELARLYPDPYAHALRERAAEANGTSPDSILFDTGADSLILLALRLFCSAGDSVVTTAGSYPTFNYFARGQGLTLQEVPYRERMNDARPDLDGLIAAAHGCEARLVYLANPDNPTGHVFSMSEIRAFRAALPDSAVLLLDEAYRDFAPDAHHDNDPIPGVMRLRTLSKAFALAGLRVGYAIAEPEVICKADEIRPQYALSSLAQLAAQTLLDAPDYSRQLITETIALREQLTKALQEQGLTTLPSATNFLAIVYPNAEEALQRQQALLKEGIALHRPPHPAMGHLLRITAHPRSLDPQILRILATR